MRIIAGNRKGMRLLDKPKGSRMRPTQDRIKENVFNILQPLKGESRVLDLFAGTGQMGLEFLSRGAVHCSFVEVDRRNFQLLSQNVAKADFGDQARCLRMDYRDFLKQDQGTYDYIYLDPPYHFDWEEAILTALVAGGFLAPGGRIILESASEDPIAEDIEGLDLTFKRAYGNQCLRIFTKPEGGI